jgi:hypothetical protein
LESIEAKWSEAREQLAIEGLAPAEHSHWDWRNKVDSVEASFHMLIAIECNSEPQGVMAVQRLPRAGRLSTESVVYVDYLESAPWNLKGSNSQPRYAGVGTVLIADAVRLSREMALGGRIGLHSLPQAEAFYTRCGMTRVGRDREYFDLSYFEFTNQQAISWLTAIGELA